MSTNSSDVGILRELARRYVQIGAKPVQNERRELWRRHNSLVKTRPLVIVRGGRAWDEIPEITNLQCQDPFFHGYERFLREHICRDTFGDDFIIEPWITVRATCRCTGWGVSVARTYSDDPKGSWKLDYPIKDPGDIDKLRTPWHEIDEADTARNAERLRDALGDILTVNVDRSPAYQVWSADLSTDLGYLRGIEHFMLDMMDRPRWLHGLTAFMRDGVLRAHEQAEAAGDWGLSATENQSMAYSRELEDPAANVNGVARRRLWGFLAAQEFTLVSPEMHDEFMLQYQIPILSQFGLSAYGCCEDLTRKIDILRRIPNLRRIAVTPRADVRKCAEQIGTDYVISWRPNPAEMVCCGFDADRIRRITRDAMEACRGLHVDITLKDIDTVENRPRRLREWVKIVRRIAEDYA